MNISQRAVQKPEPDVFKLLTDRDFYLNKQKLSLQVAELLGYCAQLLEERIKANGNFLPEEIISSGPKISRGENYLSFPWTLLDYPRFFSKNNIFAIRTLCWWGNNFSITLHVSGKYVHLFADTVFGNLNKLNQQEYYLCINDDPWQHHHQKDNYCRLSELAEGIDFYKEAALSKKFFKISRIVLFENWEFLPQILDQCVLDYLGILKTSQQQS